MKSHVSRTGDYIRIEITEAREVPYAFRDGVVIRHDRLADIETLRDQLSALLAFERGCESKAAVCVTYGLAEDGRAA